MSRADVDRLFLGGEKVYQQGRKLRLVQDFCHVTIAGTVPAAPAAVGKQHKASRSFRQGKVALQRYPFDADLHQSFFGSSSYGSLHTYTPNWEAPRTSPFSPAALPS